MPRINVVKSTRKPQGPCGKCGVEINKGDPYRWIKFRYGGKRVRCMKPTCSFRQSELVSSDKLSRLYAASETVEDALALWTPNVSIDEMLETAQAVADAVEEAMSEIEEVAQEYNDSADNIEQYFSYSETAEQCRESAESAESWRDEFDNPLNDLQNALSELEQYVSARKVQREAEAAQDNADIVVTTMDGLQDMVSGADTAEPFDSGEIENAISEIESAASNCPL